MSRSTSLSPATREIRKAPKPAPELPAHLRATTPGRPRLANYLQSQNGLSVMDMAPPQSSPEAPRNLSYSTRMAYTQAMRSAGR